MRAHQTDAADPYTWIGPAGMPIIRLLIAVKMLLWSPGVAAKKSCANAMSSSNPKTLPILPIETPKLVCFAWQFVRLAQSDESPPK